MKKLFETSLLASWCVAASEKTALNPKHSYENVKSQEQFPFPFICVTFIHLKVQLKNVEIVVIW